MALDNYPEPSEMSDERLANEIDFLQREQKRRSLRTMSVKDITNLIENIECEIEKTKGGPMPDLLWLKDLAIIGLESLQPKSRPLIFIEESQEAATVPSLNDYIRDHQKIDVVEVAPKSKDQVIPPFDPTSLFTEYEVKLLFVQGKVNPFESCTPEELAVLEVNPFRLQSWPDWKTFSEEKTLEKKIQHYQDVLRENQSTQKQLEDYQEVLNGKLDLTGISVQAENTDNHVVHIKND